MSNQSHCETNDKIYTHHGQSGEIVAKISVIMYLEIDVKYVLESILNGISGRLKI